MNDYNIKIAGKEPKFSLQIADFPEAIKKCDEIIEDRIVQMAIYQSPEFYRFDYFTGEYINWVQVHKGNIIGPVVEQLPTYKKMKNLLLSL